MIEPGIRPLLQPLSDWRETESMITQMVMKHKGVFKGDLIFISIDEDIDEKFSNEVDVEAFNKIKKWSIKRKFDYLLKHGILQNSSYEFLNKVREIRNKIHEPFYNFSEKDMTLFNYSRYITGQIHPAIMYKSIEKYTARLISNAEKIAEQMLHEF